MKCPKCGKSITGKSQLRHRIGDTYVTTHDIYEHAYHIENGVCVVRSGDCCYVRRPTPAALDGRVRGSKRTSSKPARK